MWLGITLVLYLEDMNQRTGRTYRRRQPIRGTHTYNRSWMLIEVRRCRYL